MIREEAIEKHRKMWNWLADNPGKRKCDYLNKFDPEAKLDGDCYLCEYGRQPESGCDCCPVIWPGGKCCGGGGIYAMWGEAMTTGDYARAAEIARQIAELPEKEVEE